MIQWLGPVAGFPSAPPHATLSQRMSNNFSKVIEHAEEKLPVSGSDRPDQLLERYRRFVKLEQHRLKIRHNAGGGGREIARRRAQVMDVVLQRLFEQASEDLGQGRQASRPALVATGGYGRGELNPFSDIDLMFLLPGRNAQPPREIGEFIEQVLYMLWDIGFKVGHATRTITSALQHANEDLAGKTAMLESRLIAGEVALFTEFRKLFELQCLRGAEGEYLEWRVRDQRLRHEKYGNTVFLQEPNIKSGCGGLRDYQNLLWLATVKEGVASTTALVERKLIRESERRNLERAYDFLLRVRTELHYLNGRATDILTLHFQGQVADNFHYPQKDVLRRSEAFMRDYYTHSRDIYHLTNRVMKRLSLPGPGEEERRGLRRWIPLGNGNSKIEFDRFIARQGFMYPASRDIFDDDPARMMRAFQHLQQRGLRVSPELELLIRGRLRLVNRTFQYNRANREAFEAILSRKGEVGRILRLMHQLEFLGHYLPEFRPLTCLVQHEFFHRYTADEHTLVCIEKLDELLDGESKQPGAFRKLFQRLEDPYILYLALLLHDAGKSANTRNHSEASAVMAQKVARRLQLSPARRRQLILLVDHHTTLSFMAQTRNLEDAATIREFAGLVGSVENLDALLLLTYADMNGTSEESWNEWKESLVLQLYGAARQLMSDEHSFYAARRAAKEEARNKVASLLTPDFAEEIEAHFTNMPDRYFTSVGGREIADHLRLFRNFLQTRFERPESSLAPALRWEAKPERGHSELVVCAWDRSELLTRIAGSLSAFGLNILGADIYTREDNLVLDIFRVCGGHFEPVISPRIQKEVEKLLSQSLLGEEFDMEPYLAKAREQSRSYMPPEFDFPVRIVIANDSTPKHTLVEVVAPDRLGLLHDLLASFNQARLRISSSRITTEKGAAIDTFYVTDEEGRKIEDPERIEDLQRILQETAPGPVATDPAGAGTE